MNRPTVLVLDRNRTRAEKLLGDIAAAHGLDWSWSAEASDGSLRSVPVVIGDWDLLGGGDGVRAVAGAATGALIVVTSDITQEDVVACLRAGADDCVRRDNPTRLAAAVAEALDREQSTGKGGADVERYRTRIRDLLRAERERADFVGNLSHELRTPLNVIIGYSEMMGEGAFGVLDAEQRQVIAKIRHQGCELLDIVDTTLELSRIESGRAPLDVAPVDVALLAAQILEETQVLLDGKPLEVTRTFASDIRQPHSDALKIKVILKNLVMNAIKFTERGSVSITGRNLRTGVEVAVADTGPGIAPHQRRAIFEAFRQGDSARGKRGAGLGLHIALRLLAVLGGEISLDSQVGEGSTFRVWLPLQQRRRPPQRRPTGRSPMAAMPR